MKPRKSPVRTVILPFVLIWWELFRVLSGSIYPGYDGIYHLLRLLKGIF